MVKLKRILFALLALGMILTAIGSLFAMENSGSLRPAGGSIENSQRFIEVLEKENVDAWFQGHLHSPPQTIDTRVDKWGTTFIDTGCIRDNPPESFVVFLENNKEKVVVKSRNHENREWNNLENKFSSTLTNPYRGKDLKIWVLSDMQPSSPKEWKNFQKAIKDANQNLKPDLAIIPGDLVTYGSKDQFKKFKNYIENLNVPRENIYTIAGNHDLTYETGTKNYRNLIENRLYYSIKRGNITFTLMSDEKMTDLWGTISDNTFEWWKKIVQTDNNNIITVTHEPLEGTTRGTIMGIKDQITSGLRDGLHQANYDFGPSTVATLLIVLLIILLAIPYAVSSAPAKSL